MKLFKIGIASLILIPLLFLIFNKSNGINITGDWTAKEIILNGKQLYPSNVDKYLESNYQVTVDGWTKSIQITRDEISAHYKLIKYKNNKQYIVLSSSEKSLNGKFAIEIDTIHTGSQSYKVNLKLQSNKTTINLQRIINIGPWRPERPRKGQV